MPQLRWNKVDVLECLGVLPEVEEYETKFEYAVTRDGLVLLITVVPYESVVELRLRRADSSEDILALAVLVLGEIEYKREKAGDFLQMLGSRIVVSRFYYTREGDEAILKSPAVDVELRVDPDIRVSFKYS